MRIQRDNIVIRSAAVDDAIQLNKWWNDGKVTDETINSICPIKRIVWDTMLENKRAQYVYENKIGARRELLLIMNLVGKTS